MTLSVGAFSWGIASGFLGGLHLILSPSIPPGIYRETHEPITRGSLVVACLPLEIARFAKERRYLPFGFCDGWVQPVIKFVGAVEGDVVEVQEAGVSINGVRIENSAVASVDSKGRTLSHVEFGQYRVEKERIWIFSTHVKNAWDSRYFGGVDAQQIIGTAKPIWVRE